ncbi:MAG: hypothetical protein WDN09_03245 [bacterium]
MKEINTKLENCDYKAIMWARRILPGFARFAIFLVYFWFGILKVIGLSPASPLVAALLAKTMPFISPDAFVVAFGAIEVVIGLLFVIPKLERLAIFALILHLITTIPAALLPAAPGLDRLHGADARGPVHHKERPPHDRGHRRARKSHSFAKD